VSNDFTGSGKYALLCDVDIVKRMVCEPENERIIVTPLISLKDQLGPDSLDLRLGTEFILKERSEHIATDPIEALKDPSDIESHYRVIRKVDPLDPFVLHTAEFVLATTLEYIKLPHGIFSLLQGRSTWSRQGLVVHSTASFIHAGSEGIITFELRNIGDVPILLYPGIRIAQISFIELSSFPSCSYIEKDEMKYGGNLKANIGLYWQDYEIELIFKELEKRRKEQDLN